MVIWSPRLADGRSRSDEHAFGGLRQLSRPDSRHKGSRADQEKAGDCGCGRGSESEYAADCGAGELEAGRGDLSVHGVCGADPKDAGVTKVHAKFMKVSTGVEARRIPDSSLVFPMLILALPGPLKEPKLIREMMLDLMDRLQPNKFGNEVMGRLDDI
ncbi:unnamed protein product [Rhizoctonia solani]|uniref:Uncharacterized protein n=1 Tax=Rhizoctonia solani TaxID=456999 RepID=A0A8H3DNA9_9AGAM|nr:unnamed protein product [Rhizoctonia solani]